MKRLLLAAAMLCSSASMYAQFGYKFSYTTSAYVPLGSTSTEIATDASLDGFGIFSIPHGFFL